MDANLKIRNLVNNSDLLKNESTTEDRITKAATSGRYSAWGIIRMYRGFVDPGSSSPYTRVISSVALIPAYPKNVGDPKIGSKRVVCFSHSVSGLSEAGRFISEINRSKNLKRVMTFRGEDAQVRSLSFVCFLACTDADIADGLDIVKENNKAVFMLGSAVMLRVPVIDAEQGIKSVCDAIEKLNKPRADSIRTNLKI